MAKNSSDILGRLVTSLTHAELVKLSEYCQEALQRPQFDIPPTSKGLERLENQAIIGQYLRQQREASGLSRYALKKLVGIQTLQIKAIEEGQNYHISALIRYLQALQVELYAQKH